MNEKISHKIAVTLWDEISKLDTKQLRRLINQCRTMTDTNCWWFAYELREIMLSQATDFLEERLSKHAKRVRNA